MFSHAPWDIHPAHLSRFAVRTPKILPAQLFSEAWDNRVPEPKLRLITSRSSDPAFVPIGSYGVLLHA